VGLEEREARPVGRSPHLSAISLVAKVSQFLHQLERRPEGTLTI